MPKPPKLFRMQIVTEDGEVLGQSELVRMPRKHNWFLDVQKGRLYDALQQIMTDQTFKPKVKEWLRG